MNTFKDIIENAKENPYRTINVPLYIVTKNTGKLTTVTSATCIIEFTPIVICCTGGYSFDAENYNNAEVLERVVYAGFYHSQKVITHYLFANKEKAKEMSLKILNKRKKKIDEEITKVMQM